MNHRSSHLLLLLLCSSLFLFQQVESIAWVNGVNGTWGDSAFWQGGVLPETTNSVEIIAIGEYTVAVISPTTFNGDITLGGVGANPRLVISSGVNFQVNGNINMLSGTIVVQTGATMTIKGLIISSANSGIYLDYIGNMIITDTLQISSGSLTFSGYGILDTSSTAITIGNGRSLIFEHSTFTIGSTTSFIADAGAMITMNGPLVSSSANNVNINANTQFKLGSTINGKITFAYPLIIDPTTDNTVIVNGDIQASNVSINSGSITLQTGSFSIGNTLYMNPSTLFNGASPAYISLGQGGSIIAATIANIFSDITITNGASFVTTSTSGSIIVVGNIKIMNGNLNIKGVTVLSGELSNLGSGQIVIPSQGSNILTINPGSKVTLDGTSGTQVAGAGYLVFLPGSTLIVMKTTTINNPTILQTFVQVNSGSSLSFVSPISIMNSTSFASINGDDGWVYFRGSTDIDNNGDIEDNHRFIINNINIVISSGCSVYLVGGKMEIGSNGNLWVNGTLYTTMREMNIIGVGSLTINPNGIWWVGTRARITPSLFINGQLKLNSGYLAVNNGLCSGSISMYGDLEVNGGFDYGSCKPQGNGTLSYNAMTATNHILRSNNYTIGSLFIGGSSSVSTEAGGFVLNGNLNIKGNGNLIITSSSLIKGDINLDETGILYVSGVTTTMKANNVIMSSACTLKTDADSSSSSQLYSSGNTKIGGKLSVKVSAGTPVLNEITVLNYASFSGAFSSVNVQSDQGTFYEGRYDNRKTVIIPSADQTNPTSSTGSQTGETSAPAASSTGSVNNNNNNQDNSATSNNMIIALIASLILICM